MTTQQSRERPGLVDLQVVASASANLTVIDSITCPFPIARVYTISDASPRVQRGNHAHRTLTQLMTAIKGSFTVRVDDGLGWTAEFQMADSSKGLLMPSGYWREIYDFTSDAVCLVLASQPFSESDYIRDRTDFTKWAMGELR